MFGHATYRYKVLCFYRVFKENDEPMFFAREKVTGETTSEETEETDETKSEEITSKETSSK